MLAVACHNWCYYSDNGSTASSIITATALATSIITILLPYREQEERDLDEFFPSSAPPFLPKSKLFYLCPHVKPRTNHPASPAGLERHSEYFFRILSPLPSLLADLQTTEVASGWAFVVTNSSDGVDILYSRTKSVLPRPYGRHPAVLPTH